MAEQYFSGAPESAHRPHHFAINWAGRPLSFETDAGVFSREHLDHGTALLLKSLPEVFRGRALDLGCGWGAVGVCMAAMWPQADVLLTDINPRAVDLARGNLARNGLAGEVYLGDGLANLPGAFDLICVNPPIRAGKAVCYRLLRESRDRLNPGGALHVVVRKQQGADSMRKYLLTLFDRVETVERSAGFHVFLAAG